jgi:hypothetical protein
MGGNSIVQNPPPNLGIKTETTTEAYGAIRRKPVESLKVEREERSKATPPFGFSQGREPVERQMMP